MLGLYIFGVIGGIVVEVLICFLTYKIAVGKGYNGGLAIIAALLIGLIATLIYLILPDNSSSYSSSSSYSKSSTSENSLAWQCPNCLRRNRLIDRYCSGCGKAKPGSDAFIKCEACGSDNYGKNKFCSNCGAELNKKEDITKEETHDAQYTINDITIDNNQIICGSNVYPIGEISDICLIFNDVTFKFKSIKVRISCHSQSQARDLYFQLRK